DGRLDRRGRCPRRCRRADGPLARAGLEAARRRGSAGAGAVDDRRISRPGGGRSEEHTSELQSLAYLVCRLLLEKKKEQNKRDLEDAALEAVLVCGDRHSLACRQTCSAAADAVSHTSSPLPASPSPASSGCASPL